MKLGLVTYNIASDWDLDTLIQRCQNTGYEAVELRSSHAHGVEVDLSPSAREDIRKKFEDSGVKLWCLGSACDYHRTDPAKLREHIELTKRFCQLAHDVGAPGVKVRPNDLPKEVPVEQTIQQIGTSLKECGDAARDCGVELWVEMHGWGTQEPEMMRKIMDACGHPAVGLTWNSNPVDVKDGSIDGSFELCKDFIRSVHITELINDYPWRRLFELLRSINYEGYTLQEIQPLKSQDPEDIERFMKFYRRLWLEYQA